VRVASRNGRDYTRALSTSGPRSPDAVATPPSFMAFYLRHQDGRELTRRFSYLTRDVTKDAPGPEANLAAQSEAHGRYVFVARLFLVPVWTGDAGLSGGWNST
jgi:hypothetical protein